jgi:hypothetical protein
LRLGKQIDACNYQITVKRDRHTRQEMTMISFKEFQSTRAKTDDLSAHFGEEWFDGISNKGFIYDGAFWIVENDDGSFWTTCAADEYSSTDLTAVEQWLYDTTVVEFN